MTCAPGGGPQPVPWGGGTLQSSDAATTHQQPQSHSAFHAAFCQKNIENAMVTKGSHLLERPGLDRS